jgi:diketogulonate reductase-like aldo/keto reductase
MTADEKRYTLSRRELLAALAAAAVTAVGRRGLASPAMKGLTMVTKKIPASGEPLPVIGLGTYDTFDVARQDERAPLVEVMRAFIAAGGRAVDSSPMYGRSEQVIGEVLAALGKPKMFLATKVWTTGKRGGEKQMRRSMKLMGAATMDLMQIHNLMDWRTHLATLRAWKAAGTIRYLGITHFQTGAFGEMEQIIRQEKIDFVQLPYSLGNREAEKRLLPAAAENGVAVLVMRPFEKGGLFQRVKDQPLPAWAGELGVASWAQLFLKFIVSHPAVTAAIPATSKPKHLLDNVAAGAGPMPDEAQRQRMASLF